MCVTIVTMVIVTEPTTEKSVPTELPRRDPITAEVQKRVTVIPNTISEVARGEVRTYSQVDPKDSRFNDYFVQRSKEWPRAYGRINDVVVSNRTGSFVYSADSPTTADMHIIWFHNNSENQTADSIKPDLWAELKAEPEIFERTNGILVRALDQARIFYPWNSKSVSLAKGLIIESSGSWGMERGVDLGLRVSFEEHIAPLIKAIKAGDSESLIREQLHLTASIIHELTHRERDEVAGGVQNEIMSHTAQYLFEPQSNTIFNQQINRSLLQIEKGQLDTSIKLDSYDKATHAFLGVVAKMYC